MYLPASTSESNIVILRSLMAAGHQWLWLG